MYVVHVRASRVHLPFRKADLHCSVHCSSTERTAKVSCLGKSMNSRSFPKTTISRNGLILQALASALSFPLVLFVRAWQRMLLQVLAAGVLSEVNTMRLKIHQVRPLDERNAERGLSWKTHAPKNNINVLPLAIPAHFCCMPSHRLSSTGAFTEVRREHSSQGTKCTQAPPQVAYFVTALTTPWDTLGHHHQIKTEMIFITNWRRDTSLLS